MLKSCYECLDIIWENICEMAWKKDCQISMKSGKEPTIKTTTGFDRKMSVRQPLSKPRVHGDAGANLGCLWAQGSNHSHLHFRKDS